MVNSDKGITNLHVPSDVIVDASMPAMIRTSGQMWNKDDKTTGHPGRHPGLLLRRRLPGRHRGLQGQRRLRSDHHGHCPERRPHGPEGRGVRLPRQDLQASTSDGKVEVRNAAGDVLLEHEVSEGDIWRACQAKDAPIQDWVKLAVDRARISGMPAVFWLDPERAHDRNLTTLVEKYLADHDTEGLDIRILSPIEATKLSVERIRRGEDTISVTGNVLRDYNTDLFPILELGTSAKMLSVVPLMAGGGLFETGAGGSAPKHVQQVQEENHLRWDSLGEFLALAESLRHVSRTQDNAQAAVLADALDKATEKLLAEGKSPSRKVGEIDNRGSHFYLASYWAEELAAQSEDAALAETFRPVAEALAAEAATIDQELIDNQGSAVDLGGYYNPSDEKTSDVMRPSSKFNEIIDGLKK